MAADNKTVTLTQKNVEDFVFFDQELQKKFPEFADLFQTWRLGKRITALRPSAQKSVLTFLERLTTQHLDILSDYLGVTVTVEKLDHHLVCDYAVNINQAAQLLNREIKKYHKFFSYRDGEQLYICFWR